MLKIKLLNGATFTDVLEVEFIKNGKEISALTDDYDTIQIFVSDIDKIEELRWAGTIIRLLHQRQNM